LRPPQQVVHPHGSLRSDASRACDERACGRADATGRRRAQDRVRRPRPRPAWLDRAAHEKAPAAQERTGHFGLRTAAPVATWRDMITTVQLVDLRAHAAACVAQPSPARRPQTASFLIAADSPMHTRMNYLSGHADTHRTRPTCRAKSFSAVSPSLLPSCRSGRGTSDASSRPRRAPSA